MCFGVSSCSLWQQSLPLHDVSVWQRNYHSVHVRVCVCVCVCLPALSACVWSGLTGSAWLIQRQTRFHLTPLSHRHWSPFFTKLASSIPSCVHVCMCTCVSVDGNLHQHMKGVYLRVASPASLKGNRPLLWYSVSSNSQRTFKHAAKFKTEM